MHIEAMNLLKVKELNQYITVQYTIINIIDLSKDMPILEF